MVNLTSNPQAANRGVFQRNSHASGLRYALLVAGQTMAQSMPRQQTPNRGQMIQNKHDVV